MSYLAIAKRVLKEIEERESVSAHKPETLKTLTESIESGQAEEWGLSCPSVENALRSIDDRLSEARELLGELTYLYNERASAFEFAGLARAEAERLAMREVQATEAFRRWRSLG